MQRAYAAKASGASEAEFPLRARRGSVRWPGPPYVWLLIPAVLVLLVFFVLPLLTMIRYSLYTHVAGGMMQPVLTFDNFQHFFQQELYRRVLAKTLLNALITTLLALLLGYPVAYVIARGHPLVRRILLIAVISPLLVGIVIRSYGWLVLLNRHLHSIFVQNALLMAALQEGDVVMTGPFYSNNIWPYIDAGLPANHIVPREGGFAGLSCQTLVHGGPYPELGAAFINEVLAPETQAMLCQKLNTAPVVQGVALPAQTLERLAYDEDKTGKLLVSDWEFINTIRPEWTERWNKIFS